MGLWLNDQADRLRLESYLYINVWSSRNLGKECRGVNFCIVVPPGSELQRWETGEDTHEVDLDEEVEIEPSLAPAPQRSLQPPGHAPALGV